MYNNYRLTNSTALSYMEINFGVRDISSMEKDTPAKLN